MRKLPSVLIGLVTARDDPDGLGRVKLRIPGVVDDETPNWAEPLGIPGGGSAQRGTFDPPAVGASVAVFFKLGDPDHPMYVTGPYGQPGGASDAPDGAAVQGDDRQAIITEDEEWRIQRDSRTSAVQRWKVEHKDTGVSVEIDGDDGRLYLGDSSATDKIVKGSEYRTAEVAYLGGLHSALATFATSISAAIDLAAVNAAGTALGTALGLIPGTDIKDDATAYLSDVVYTE